MKMAKLTDQGREGPAPLDNLFAGVVVYVNGLTGIFSPPFFLHPKTNAALAEPPADTLKRLLQQHSGEYSAFNIPSLVTHVLATNLCDAKLKATPKQVVVTPAWVVDSIAAGRRLPVADYILTLKLDPAQPRLPFVSAAPPVIEEKEARAGLQTADDFADEDGADNDNDNPAPDDAKVG